MTTISVRAVTSGSSTTSIDVRVPTDISCDLYPTNEYTRTAFSPTWSEYLPSIPVQVPLLVPFSTTFTAGIGSPSSEEVTLPVTVLCAQAAVATKTKRTIRHLRQQKYNFVMLLLVWVNIG